MDSFMPLDKNAGIMDWLIKDIALISGKPEVWSECSWVNNTASIFVHFALYSCALKSGLVSISKFWSFISIKTRSGNTYAPACLGRAFFENN